MSKVPLVPQSALGGNTKPPKQSSPKKNWCMTLNNWKVEEYDSLLEWFKEDSSNRFIIGKEVGELGTPHLQIWVEFKTKKRFEQIKKFNTRLNIRPQSARATVKDNLSYCSKDKDYVTNCRIPKELEVIKDLRPYQQKIVDIVLGEPEARKVYWFYGDKNIGKTEILFKLCAEYGAMVIPISKRHALSQVYKTHEDTDIYCMNLTADESEYQTHDMFSIIEAIKDRMFSASFGTECNGMCLMNHKHMIIVGNEPPDFEKTQIDKKRFYIFKIDENYDC